MDLFNKLALTSTEATADKRDATSPLAGATRDAVIVGVVTWVLIHLFGLSDLCSQEVSTRTLALVTGVASGGLTGIRKVIADALTPKPA